MQIIRSITKMQKIAAALGKRRTIALVPTMGALHDGHLSLIKIAKRNADRVIVTIFVNPTQFGRNEDFSLYPRRESDDVRKIKKMGVGYVFIPKTADMYPAGFHTTVSVGPLARVLCGKTRPGHFDGVAGVVLKLFHITQPDVAVFGAKDIQQLVVIRTLVRELNLPVKIVAAPIVREKDGLAMSSRNRYLTAEERQLALCLSRGLFAVKKACVLKLPDVNRLRRLFLTQVSGNAKVRVDYFACVDKETLAPLKKIKRGQTLVAAAVYIGKTRLIDNVNC